MSSLYIHIPFCKSKCHYCAFNSYPNLDLLFERYFQAIKVEIACLKVTHPFKTIFFGGGTPTVLGAKRLCGLIDSCTKHSIDKTAEISIEANPETIDLKGLRELKDGGVNRISFGVQSFNDDDLQTLGRAHKALRAIEAIAEAKSVGFDNVNLDLMSALPGQNPAMWRKVLKTALSLKPKHLSIYQLTPEEDTKFFDDYVADKVSLPSDEISLKMDSITKELCLENGLIQYEISNYAKIGYQCLHNINYWKNNDYYAVGAGAVSYFEGCRERRVDSPIEYCDRIAKNESVIVGEERLDSESSFRETVIIGLRMIEGVSVKSLEKRFKIKPINYYGEIWQQFEQKGLVETKDGNMRITEKGRPLSNTIMAELV